MLNKMSISWSCKQVANMVKKGKCSFDNIIQRSYVWEKARKSNLIHSLIENYPVPPFYTRRIDGGVYDFLDGKQRINAIVGYIDNEYELTKVPVIKYEVAESNEIKEVDITGKKFDDLPGELQDAILSYNLTIYYYDDITDMQVATMFRKLNNGKPLSTKERNIANCSDIRKVSKIGEHEFFKSIITAKGLGTRKQIPLIMKMWCMLYQEDVSFESRTFNAVMEGTEITDDQNRELNTVLDKLQDMYVAIGENRDKKEARLLRKKLSTETHLISFVPFVKKAIDEGTSTTMLVDFFDSFFGVETASISDVYNEACNGSAKAVNVSRRGEELRKAWEEFFDEDGAENSEAAEEDEDEEDEEDIEEEED